MNVPDVRQASELLTTEMVFTRFHPVTVVSKLNPTPSLRLHAAGIGMAPVTSGRLDSFISGQLTASPMIYIPGNTP